MRAGVQRRFNAVAALAELPHNIRRLPLLQQQHMRETHVRVVQQRVRWVPREELLEELGGQPQVPFLVLLKSLGALPAQLLVECRLRRSGARGWIHGVGRLGMPAVCVGSRWRALRSGVYVGARREGLP
jgi:hypothetical protein